MARLSFEPGRRRCAAATLGVLLAAGWITASRAPAADITGELVLEQYKDLKYTRDGLTAIDVVFTHGADTHITSSSAELVRQSGGTSELNLAGKVHVEFRGALLDASSAVLKFRGPNLVAIEVKGSQATFSHQPEGYSRRVDGRADAIDFDAATTEVKFSGNTFFDDGRAKLESNIVYYNITSGIARDDGDSGTRSRAVIKLGDEPDRVPPPRQPDRSKAR